MKAIYKAPGKAPETIDIPNTLEALQEKVGGYIETVTIATDAAIICNEEGRIMGLPHNCVLRGVDFVGPILIVGVRGPEFTDLSDAAIDLFLRRGGGAHLNGPPDSETELEPGLQGLYLFWSCRFRPGMPLHSVSTSNVGMPIDVTYGGTRTKGTAKVSNGTVTFTAA